MGTAGQENKRWCRAAAPPGRAPTPASRSVQHRRCGLAIRNFRFRVDEPARRRRNRAQFRRRWSRWARSRKSRRCSELARKKCSARVLRLFKHCGRKTVRQVEFANDDFHVHAEIVRRAENLNHAPARILRGGRPVSDLDIHHHAFKIFHVVVPRSASLPKTRSRGFFLQCRFRVIFFLPAIPSRAESQSAAKSSGPSA